MRRGAAVLALAALLAALMLCACGRGEQSGAEYISVWRPVAARFQAGGELVRQEQEELAAGVTALDAAVRALGAQSADPELNRALPGLVHVEDYSQDGAAVSLWLSEEYLSYTGMDSTVLDCCCTLTLCALEGVDAVTIYSGGDVVRQGLRAEDFVVSDTDSDPYRRQVRLYFTDAAGRYLVSEYHSLTVDEGVSLERYVVEELLRGPNTEALRSAIPAGTALRSAATRDGVCTLDISGEFLTNKPGTVMDERLAVYSLVNSLTSLSGVSEVLITVDGQRLDRYVYKSLAEPLARNEAIIGPVNTARGERDVDVYFRAGPDGPTAAIPCIAQVQAEDAGAAQAVLDIIMGVTEPGLISPAPEGLLSAQTIAGVCTVDLAGEFFTLAGNENGAETAVKAVAASLCSLDEVDVVVFTLEGGQALSYGRDWTGPWHLTESEN